MRKPKGFILLFAALFVLLGSIGVNVFLHTCEEDGTFVSYFAPADEEAHCADAHDELPPCCESNDHLEKDDCCNDEIKYYKVKLDYFQKISTPFIPVSHVPQPVLVDVDAWTDHTLEINTYANPPPLPRNTYRSLVQAWII